MRPTFVSLPWGQIYPAPESSEAVVCLREIDWGLGPLRRRILHLTDALRIVWRARRYERLLVCTAGGPTLVAALAKQALARKTELVAVDFLRPPRLPVWMLRFGVRLVDRFVVVRGGDVEMLVNLGCPRERTSFVVFPAPNLSTLVASGDAQRDPYVYSGGAAQRDWTTLFEALGRTGVNAVVACPEPAAKTSPNVHEIGVVSPDVGRSWLAGSKFLVMAIHDNDLPSGPLMLLDAFALGRCVVASDTNGTRDYIQDGENGILVPPNDPAALAAAVVSLFNDPDRVEALGRAARATAQQLNGEQFWNQVLA